MREVVVDKIDKFGAENVTGSDDLILAPLYFALMAIVPQRF